MRFIYPQEFFSLFLFLVFFLLFFFFTEYALYSDGTLRPPLLACWLLHCALSLWGRTFIYIYIYFLVFFLV